LCVVHSFPTRRSSDLSPLFGFTPVSPVGGKMKVRRLVMANPKKRVPENVAGDFFVDSTCIDCDACRQIALEVFGETLRIGHVVRSEEHTSELQSRENL